MNIIRDLKLNLNKIIKYIRLIIFNKKKSTNKKY